MDHGATEDVYEMVGLLSPRVKSGIEKLGLRIER